MKTLNILKKNIFLEHVAILQYIIHMFLIKDERLRREIEEIAKEEMKHMHMFASRAVYIGGKVEIESVEEDIKACDDITDLIKEDIKAEEEAIEIYSSQIELTGDDITKKMLELIVEDEKKHKSIFEYIAEELEKDRYEKMEENAIKETTAFLNSLLKDKYTEVINTVEKLLNTKNPSEKDFYLYKAIEKMKLMGKIGEAMAEKGIHVCFKHTGGKADKPEADSIKDILSVLEEFGHKESFMKEYEKELKEDKGFTIGDLTSQ